MKDGDAINKIIERAGRNYVEKVEADLRQVQYSKPRAWPMSFCLSCANREDDPIFAACSVCRQVQNGRPTQYRRKDT